MIRERVIYKKGMHMGFFLLDSSVKGLKTKFVIADSLRDNYKV